MTTVILTDDLCDTGKFMDSLSPDTRRHARTLDAPPPPKPAFDGLAAVVSNLRAACEIARDALDNNGDALLRELALGQLQAALEGFEAWRGAK